MLRTTLRIRRGAQGQTWALLCLVDMPWASANTRLSAMAGSQESVGWCLPQPPSTRHVHRGNTYGMGSHRLGLEFHL